MKSMQSDIEQHSELEQNGREESSGEAGAHKILTPPNKLSPVPNNHPMTTVTSDSRGQIQTAKKFPMPPLNLNDHSNIPAPTNTTSTQPGESSVQTDKLSKSVNEIPTKIDKIQTAADPIQSSPTSQSSSASRIILSPSGSQISSPAGQSTPSVSQIPSPASQSTPSVSQIPSPNSQTSSSTSSNKILYDQTHRQFSKALTPAMCLAAELEAVEVETLNKRDKIIHEMLTTEVDYVYALDMITSHFAQPLEKLKIVKKSKHGLLFDFIHIISSFHDVLIRDIRKTSFQNIHVIFATHANSFRCYKPFILSFESRSAAMQKLLARNPRFRKHCDQKLADFQCSLESLLIQPVQRLPRYSLLLKELLLETPKDHKDHAMVAKSVAEISLTLSWLNEEKRKQDTSTERSAKYAIPIHRTANEESETHSSDNEPSVTVVEPKRISVSSLSKHVSSVLTHSKSVSTFGDSPSSSKSNKLKKSFSFSNRFLRAKKSHSKTSETPGKTQSVVPLRRTSSVPRVPPKPAKTMPVAPLKPPTKSPKTFVQPTPDLKLSLTEHERTQSEVWEREMSEANSKTQHLEPILTTVSSDSSASSSSVDSVHSEPILPVKKRLNRALSFIVQPSATQSQSSVRSSPQSPSGVRLLSNESPLGSKSFQISSRQSVASVRLANKRQRRSSSVILVSPQESRRGSIHIVAGSTLPATSEFQADRRRSMIFRPSPTSKPTHSDAQPDFDTSLTQSIAEPIITRPSGNAKTANLISEALEPIITRPSGNAKTANLISEALEPIQTEPTHLTKSLKITNRSFPLAPTRDVNSLPAPLITVDKSKTESQNIKFVPSPKFPAKSPLQQSDLGQNTLSLADAFDRFSSKSTSRILSNPVSAFPPAPPPRYPTRSKTS